MRLHLPLGPLSKVPSAHPRDVGTDSTLGVKRPGPELALVVPNWVSELLGERTEKTLVQPRRQEFWRLPGGGSGCPVLSLFGCPLRKEVSEAPVSRLFQRLPTFDLESPVVNFKVQLRCGEEMSRAHGSPSSGFLGGEGVGGNGLSESKES